jgi:hypothetical protein
MEEELHGEDAGSNWALNVFEGALDWGLGLGILRWLESYAKNFGTRYVPKKLIVGVNRKGDVFVLGPKTGKPYLVA